MVFTFYYAVPQILPKNFAHGSCPVFVVFRQISVKQKLDRAHLTFCFWVRAILDKARLPLGWPRRML